jgi:hypothetical protein
MMTIHDLVVVLPVGMEYNWLIVTASCPELAACHVV